eukprot:TRINITY_DN27555_c0_g1_i2.p1 TRINITY_DN27555_c0_g1~~TRINITY_DN27555_c0_g1_i2.p1  ORF type:complete len:105 (+),score=35.05 TRINITY_DN27555_c0_g1_i2:183-497(+)
MCIRDSFFLLNNLFYLLFFCFYGTFLFLNHFGFDLFFRFRRFFGDLFHYLLLRWSHLFDFLHNRSFLYWIIFRLLFPYSALIPCLLYTSPSPRDRTRSRMPSSA